MGTNPASEIGEPGTSRYRRIWEMQGMSQKKFGQTCKPAMEQAQISQFDCGRLRMTWKLARRIAPALEPKLFAGGENEQKLAMVRVWMTWFRNVECHGEHDMKSFANAMKRRIGAELFALDKTLWDLVQKAEPARVDELPYSTNEHAPAGTTVVRKQA